MVSNGTASLNVTSGFRAGPIRWLIFGGISLILAIATCATFMAANFRERALHNGERELENTVLLLTRHFDQQLQDFEVVQKDLIGFMRSNRISTTPDDFRRKMSSEDIHRTLKSKMDALSYVGGVNVFDADGALINSSSQWPVPPVNVADRAYFKSLKSAPPSQEMVLEPIHSRITGIWTTLIARRVTGENGQFLGVVGRGIVSENFEKFFATVALAPGATISMHHRDGTLLARYPHVEDMIGKNFKTGPTSQQQVFELAHTVSRLASPVDGKDRLIASRALTKFPLVVVATSSADGVLTDWREQITILVAIAGASVLAIAVLLLVVVRKLSHQHRLSQQRLMLEKRRLDTAINNMTQGLLMFDSSHRLVICNQRYLEMYGLSAQVVRPGVHFQDIIAHRYECGSFDGDKDRYVDHVLRYIGQRHMMVITTPDGRWIQVVNKPLAEGGWVATHEDITERRRTEERIAHLAHYDALTDLPNRSLFRGRRRAGAADSAPERQLAVIYIDIDEFKGINDSLGPYGRRRAAEVGGQSRLTGCVREMRLRRPAWRRRVRHRADRHVADDADVAACRSHLSRRSACPTNAWPPGHHRRQHRHRPRPAGRHRHRRDPEECRPGNVCGEVGRPPHGTVLRVGNGCAGPRPPGAGDGFAPGDRRRSGLRGLLPAAA